MSGASSKKFGESENSWVHTHHGLCSTCALASGCTFPRHPRIPVMHCDEFKGYECRPIAAREILARSASAAVKQDFLAGESVGLCRNCKHRDGCTYPKPTRGVLCCDEYE